MVAAQKLQLAFGQSAWSSSPGLSITQHDAKSNAAASYAVYYVHVERLRRHHLIQTTALNEYTGDLGGLNAHYAGIIKSKRHSAGERRHCKTMCQTIHANSAKLHTPATAGSKTRRGQIRLMKSRLLPAEDHCPTLAPLTTKSSTQDSIPSPSQAYSGLEQTALGSNFNDKSQTN